MAVVPSSDVYQFILRRCMSMSEILQTIGENQVKHFPTGEEVQLKSFWADNDVVIYFLRRYGCPVCRWLAKNISRLQPIFDSNNVKLVGMSPQTQGSDEFLKSKLFSGELYIDEKKKCYKDLEYQQYSFFGALMALKDKDTQFLSQKAKEEGISGDIRGDWYQMGGLLVIRKGGEVLLNFKQQKGSDHVENPEILKALGIDAALEEASDKPAECDAAACSM
uniref:Prostamide/prostaglandin F synthase n=1 Tax=Phallusia mammillata TaxID=59560 RepID=A0A6F9DQE5_9ASCI|nr:prostamide/prostaglandin F synthase-like [Phallusia mammillata]